MQTRLATFALLLSLAVTLGWAGPIGIILINSIFGFKKDNINYR
jgi:hypothetical protein